MPDISVRSPSPRAAFAAAPPRSVIGAAPQRSAKNPWHALWAMMVGFFMILVDATIVAVANPAILNSLDTDYDGVLWVTSAYLLAYAVPLLLAGRLGDRFGPKNLYLIGLAVFTVSSLLCGLAGSIELLVAARVVQGLGAALMTPQTLSAITRIFPPERRGVALSVWGATAGVATLVGPLAGGVLVDGLGWQWIFIVNVPIGIIGLGLAYWFVPTLSTERVGFDLLGVLLSGLGLFLIVFGLQEGESHAWAWWIWGLVAAGLALMAAFVYWQSVTRGAPLVPLKIFRDNDFSMANLGIAVIGFAVTAMVVPVMFYAQAVCGLSPTRSALLMAPMAIASGALAPFVGKLVDRTDPRPIVGFGFSAVAIALTWLSVELLPTTPIWRLVLPLILMGVGMAFIWSPLAATATRNLPPQLSGAGSGVYNTTRQIGGVLGSAGIAAFMTARIAAELPGGGTQESLAGAVVELPPFLKGPFAAALSTSLLLPAFVALFGVVAAIFLRGASSGVQARWAHASPGTGRPVGPQVHEIGAEPDYFPDDDEYVEFTVDWDDEHVHPAPAPPRPPVAEPITEVIPAVVDEPVPAQYGLTAFNGDDAFDRADDFDVPADADPTDPLPIHVEHPLHAPADAWHSGPVESWHSLLEDEPLDEPVVAEPQQAPVFDVDPVRKPEPIGFAHNGFHVNGAHVNGAHYLQAPEFELPEPRAGGRHSRGDDDAGPPGRHSRG